MIITTESNLWSCGRNDNGQLGLEHTQNQKKFQKTKFSNISKVSLGANHSLFQNEKGEIYSCGYNFHGQLGLGSMFSSTQLQITPVLIPNLPSNIIQFECGCQHNLFLDVEGNVYSVGSNEYGQLGFGYKTDLGGLDNKNDGTLIQIQNIPPIQIISVSTYCSYLLDFEGNVWSFGDNKYGQLGHGDNRDRTSPTKIKSLKDIKQVSSGRGFHFLFKDSQNKIFATGNNDGLQLGTMDVEQTSIPVEIDSQFSTIWGEEPKTVNRGKSARK